MVGQGGLAAALLPLPSGGFPLELLLPLLLLLQHPPVDRGQDRGARHLGDETERDDQHV